uniref:Olfactory receptor family 2 subfamily B member 11 n=1 Tax=Saimiri boliviensis boliviensis TaxID=39432 RepID=A0A2K6UD08_SAIBB
MKSDNQAFVLLGVSDRPRPELPLFLVLLLSCVLAVLGNVAIILASRRDPQLRSPLSLLDLCYTTATVPQMLVSMGSARKATSCGYAVFRWLGCSECVALAAVAVDRYVAICEPLRHAVLMRHALCQQLVALAWLGGLGSSRVQVGRTVQSPFCGRQVLNSFFLNAATLAVLVAAFVLVALALVLLCCGFTARAVLRVQSSEGRRKASGACSPRPPAAPSPTCLPAGHVNFPPLSHNQPDLNPFVYTLRNPDVKGALRRLLARIWSLCG